MSFAGSNPKSVTYTFTPQSADPSNPAEGDVYFSDGTPRDVGLWVYASGAWSQVSTGATLSVLDTLTLTPQNAAAEAAVPLSTPTEGLTYRADGSGRAEGIWTYQGGGWAQVSGKRHQEFKLKEPIEVRVATTANLSIASDLDNGSVVDGLALVTGDLVLVKNQTTASENGVYVVPITGAASRYSGADTVDELNGAIVYVNRGTAGQNTFRYQTATLTSLSDNQVWGTTPNNPTHTFTVPAGVYQLNIEACAGGGAGGGTAWSSFLVGSAAGKGAGGSGCLPQFFSQPVEPGDVISIKIGVGGLPARNIQQSTGGATVAAAGGAGGTTVITFPLRTVTLTGANGGGGGTSPNVSGAAGTTPTVLNQIYTTGGVGVSGSYTIGTSGQSNIYAAGGGPGDVYGGGGGGAGRLPGSAAGVQNGDSPVPAAGSGAGGGGGALTNGPGAMTRSAWGGSGYVRFSWE